MTAKKQIRQIRLGEISFDPLSEPCTIPSGWHVAAFESEERQPFYSSVTAAEPQQSSAKQENTPYGSTQNSL